MSKAHPGFKNVAKGIAQRQGIPIERANAILASAAHKASPMAIQKNPRIKRVLHTTHVSPKMK